MLRKCDVCQISYEAKRASSKFCSDRCRIRNARGTVMAPVAELPVARVRDDESDTLTPLTDATSRELLAAGQLDTAAGQRALLLARRLDTATVDTGSSVAALVREHGMQLQAAVDAGVHEDDPLDEISKRILERRRA